MRYPLLALPIALLWPAAARPDEATDLRDRAVQAAAKDPADLQKFRIHTIKAKGISKLTPEPVPAAFELAAVYPGQLKATWEFGTGATKNSVTVCASNDQGWKRVGSLPAADMGLEDLNDLRADAYAIWVATLMPLTDPQTKLAAVGRSKVGNDAVVGLKVSRRPWPDVVLWFDANTHLLRRMNYRSREAGAMLNKEMIYGGHKEISGLKVPTTHTTIVQGREVYSWLEMEYAFPDRLDVKTFAKP
jgi:hypothetical protein